MIDETTQQKLVLKLEENAMDSLVHGIEHYLYGKRNTDWKYAILHVFHAVELSLKARLAKKNESLIYRTEKDRRTVGVDEAINRLVNEVKLSPLKYFEHVAKKDQQSNKYKLSGKLDILRDARNSIEHMEADLDKDKVQSFLGTAFIFLDSFVTEELGLSLKAELDKLDKEREEEFLEQGIEIEDQESQNTYQTLSMAYFFYIKHMTRAGIPILDPHEKDMDYDYFSCEEGECEEVEHETIAVPDPISRYPRVTHCFCCLTEYTVHYCPICGNPDISFLKAWEKDINLSSYPDWVKSIDSKDDSACLRCIESLKD